MNYTHCFFDLDGTVIDSSPGITQSVQYALRKCGLEAPPANELLGFIGPALSWSFSHFFGMDSEEFCRRMILEGKVAAVPGSCFGLDGYIRISYCYSDRELEKGLDRMAKFIQSI